MILAYGHSTHFHMYPFPHYDKEKNAVQLAEQVLQLAKYPKEGLLGLHDVSLEKLESIKGIGRVKAVKLKSIAELSVRAPAVNFNVIGAEINTKCVVCQNDNPFLVVTVQFR